MPVMPRSSRTIDVRAPTSAAVSVDDIACGLATFPLLWPQATFHYPLAQHAVDVARTAQAGGLASRGVLAALHFYSASVYGLCQPAAEDGWRAAVAEAFGFVEWLAADESAAVAAISRDVEIEAAAVLLADGGERLAEASGRSAALLTATGPKRRPVRPPQAVELFVDMHRALVSACT